MVWHKFSPPDITGVAENFQFLYFHSKIRPHNSISRPTVCAKCVNLNISLCDQNVSIFFGLSKYLSAIFIVLEKLLVGQEKNIQQKFQAKMDGI